MNTSPGPGEGSHRHILGRGLGTFSMTAGGVMQARTGHLTWTGPFNACEGPTNRGHRGTLGRQEPGTDAFGDGTAILWFLSGGRCWRRFAGMPPRLFRTCCSEAVSRNDFIQGICREPSSWRSDAVSLSAPVP
jgi:hypothetical protein